MMTALGASLAAVPSQPPTVYGYLLAEDPDELEIAAWQRELRHVCRQRGYALANIFVDRGELGDTLARPGLGGLFDVLAMPGTYGFIVPSIDHLARSPSALMVLGQRLSQMNTQIIVLSGAPSADIHRW